MERHDQEHDPSKIDDGYEKPAAILNVDSAPAPPPSDNTSTGPKKKKRFLQKLRKPIPVLTIVIALAAIAQVVVTWWQLGSMDRQLQEMKSNSKQTDDLIQANKDQITALQDANRLTAESSRARLERKGTQIEKPIVVGGNIAVNVYLENVGHTAAFNVRSAMEVKRLHGLPEGNMPIEMPASGETLEPGPPGHRLYMTDPEPVTEVFLKGLPPIRRSGTSEGKELTTYFYGRFEYVTLGRPHYTEFCFYLTNANSSDLPFAAQLIEKRFTPMQCSKWHNAD